MNGFGLEIGDYIEVFFDGDETQHMVGPITGWIDNGCIIRDGVEVVYAKDEIMYIDDIEQYYEQDDILTGG